MIELVKQGRRIVLRTSDHLTGMKTAIPGAYLTTSGHWTVPLDMETCRLLRQKFGSKLRVTSELRRWAMGITQSRKAMSALAKAPSAELEVLPSKCPKLYSAMEHRPYQLAGVRFLADNRATLLADDPGLGKTLIALGAVIESEVPGPYLVVAPKTASDSVWRREIHRWLPRPYQAITMPELRPAREKLLQCMPLTATTWVIVHPEMVMAQSYLTCTECGKSYVDKGRAMRQLPCGHMRRGSKSRLVCSYPMLFERTEWGVIIVDECHDSLIKRTGLPTQRRRGIEALPLRTDSMRIAMSGTPCDSKPHQLWGTLNWLNPTVYSAFHRWAELYWLKGGYTGFEIGEFRKDREQLLWDSLSSISLRRTKGEVANDLPPKLYVGTPFDPDDPSSPVGIWLPMSGRQAKAYRDIERYSVTELASGRLETITALAELTRLKQLASSFGDIERHRRNGETYFKYEPRIPSNKLSWIIDSLEEWGYPHNPLTKVVIVSFYSGIMRAFARALETHFKTKSGKHLCTGITGNTPMDRRKAIIDRFNTTQRYPSIMFLNVRAGGTAITLDSADRMIFVSETRNPDQQRQAEDRIHRVSNPRQCMYYYLRSIGTVDIGTALINQEREQDTHRLLDTRRGIDYVRHVLDLSHH